MLRATTRYATTHPKRVIALWVVIGLALAALGGLKSYSVTTDDTAQFLPHGSPSAQAVRYGQEAFGVQKGTSTVTVLLERADGGALTAADGAAVRSLGAGLPRWRPDLDALRSDAEGVDVAQRAGRIVDTAAGPVADGGRFALVAVQWQANATDPVALGAFRQLRDEVVRDARAHELRAGFTGGVASAADFDDATKATQLLASLLLFGAVLVLSAVFFRGVLAAILPLLAIVVVSGAATGLVVGAALVLGFELDQSTPQLITVVLVGVGIDYFLFLLFRVRERLRAGDDRRTAAAHAAARVGPAIASAALVVAAAFATLGLAQFGQFRVLGPSIAISVLVMLLAGITFMPAIAAVTGRALFWPSPTWMHERADGRAARLGALIARRPGRVALGATALLVVLSVAALGARSDYDLSSGGPDTPATRTADQITASLPEGAGDPQQVYVRSTTALTPQRLAPLRARLASVDGVGSVSGAVLTDDRHGARIDVALDAASTTTAGMAVARGPLRDVLRTSAPAGSQALLGGNAAVFADVGDSIGHDLRLIFPIAAVLILLVLIAMLRSAVASLFLLAAVGLEFVATLGSAVFVFQDVGGADGVAFTLPLVLFLFVVALGTDYNILMTARLREELRAGRAPRDAVAEGVRHAAPAIAAAGLVLATSFATLMLTPDAGARQMGFAMAVGILLASLIVSSLLVPAVMALAGSRRGIGVARLPADAERRLAHRAGGRGGARHGA